METQGKADKKKFLLLRSKEKNNFVDYFKDKPILSDISFDTNNINKAGWTYIYQDINAFKILSNLRLKNPDVNFQLLDVGSRFDSVIFFATQMSTTFLEARGKEGSFPDLNIKFIKGEAQNILVKDNSFNIITSLHALEHFGLGRYGDTIDYYGDQKSLKEFKRVLAPGGLLILSVPACRDYCIKFNEGRFYSPDVVDAMLESAGFSIQKRYFIFPYGTVQIHEESSTDKHVTMMTILEDDQGRRIFDKWSEFYTDIDIAYFTLSKIV